MKKHLSFILLFTVLQLTMVFAIAQNATFTATAIPQAVSVGEQFHINFSLNADGSNFKPPAFNDFHIIQGPSQSSSMQFINGNMSQSLSFNYVLQPKAEGTFKIGPATIQFEGKTIKSNIVSIVVAKNAAASSQQESIEKQIGENLYIKVTANKKKVYKGEGINVSYKLFSKLDLLNFNPTKMPTLNGFWSQEGPGAKKLELKREIIDGEQYITCDLKKAVVFPQRDGTLTLDPLEAEAVVRVRTNRKSKAYDPFEDFFNDPFFGGGSRFQEINYKLKSTPVTITVNPLPANAPLGYSGAVGNFAIESFIDKPQTKSNEPVTLKISITGSGNIKLIEPVAVPLPPDIETYDPKIVDNINLNQGQVSGKRTFEYLLLPRNPGNFKIKPLEFSYFSIEKNKYVTLATPELELKVTGSMNANSGGTIPSGKENLKQIGNDIRFIKTGKMVWNSSKLPLFGSTTFYSMLATPFLFAGLFIFYYRKQKEITADPLSLRSKKAERIAKKRLASVKKYLDEKKYDKVYEEILRSLYGYFSDKFQIPVAELSKSKIEETLVKKGKEIGIVTQFISIIEDCEFGRYAPSSATPSSELYDRSITAITRLEEN